MVGCFCFSLCTPAEAAAFFASLPTRLVAPSPWFGYLGQVYGNRSRSAAGFLPTLELRTLEFWYHRHRRWPKDVEWPMATCMPTVSSKALAFAHTAWRRDPRASPCDAATCARWLAPGASVQSWLAASRSNYLEECIRRDTSCIQQGHTQCTIPTPWLQPLPSVHC